MPMIDHTYMGTEYSDGSPDLDTESRPIITSSRRLVERGDMVSDSYFKYFVIILMIILCVATLATLNAVQQQSKSLSQYIIASSEIKFPVGAGLAAISAPQIPYIDTSPTKTSPNPIENVIKIDTQPNAVPTPPPPVTAPKQKEQQLQQQQQEQEQQHDFTPVDDSVDQSLAGQHTDQLLRPRPPLMLSVTSHPGTREDVNSLGRHLGFRVHWITFEDEFTKKGADSFEKGYHQLQASFILESFCRTYDIITISDNVWGAHLFLQLQLEDVDCAKKVLMITTNRFDVYLINEPTRRVNQVGQWRDVLNNALITHNWNYPVIVQNNPYESYYMWKSGVVRPSDVHKHITPPPPNNLIPTIRSLGTSPIPLDTSVSFVSNPPECLYFLNWLGSAADRKVLRYARRNGLTSTCKTFQSPYGGPTFIYKHNTAFWAMPYQVSVMKQSELVQAGVITLTPSPELWFEIYAAVPNYKYLKTAFDHLQSDNMDMNQIRQYVDIWSPAYAPCTVEFNSFTELQEIITTQSWRQKTPECHELRKYFQNAQYGLWHNLFQTRFPDIPIRPASDDERNAVKHLYDMDI